MNDEEHIKNTFSTSLPKMEQYSKANYPESYISVSSSSHTESIKGLKSVIIKTGQKQMQNIAVHVNEKQISRRERIRELKDAIKHGASY